MDIDKEFRQVDELDIGLDRSHITYQGQIEVTGSRSESSNDDTPHPRDPSPVSSTSRIVNKVRQKKHIAGVKIRKTLHIAKAEHEVDEPDPDSLVLVDTTEGKQSKSRLDHKSTASEKHTFKDLLHNPIDTVKSKGWCQGNQEVAANIAVSEVPHGQEVDLVNAAAAIEQATTTDAKAQAQQTFADMLNQRQSIYVRWSLDRHVTKIRVLPRDTAVLKPRSDFEKQDAGGRGFTDWRTYGSHLLDYYAHRYGGQYIGYGSDPPTPSKETIMPNIERLIVATSPFQEFIMTTRRVYRWEKPLETTKYLVIYLVLWYFNLLLPGMMSALLYLVVERRWHGQSIQDLREDIEHREDVERTALSLTEFIEKQGDENWAHDLLQDLGPWLMVQLADLANFFESVRNFYEWRKPMRTLAVIVVMTNAILITVFTPLWLIIKMSTFSAGFTFFCLFPVSVNFPNYRLLVSPSKRLLWNIPTHAEWAIQYIQAEGLRVITEKQNTSAKATDLKYTNDLKDSASPSNQDFASYRSQFDKTPGHLIINATGVRFVANRPPHEVRFSLPYVQINQLEKQDRYVEKMIKVLKECDRDLRFLDRDGREWILHEVEKRDEAFSQIVGFSRTTWQVLW
ncbi:uncharacterized protein J4E92_007688 [Alternaria infectoria]|uniref:uncharacterized protein n=1 Tax=Alternaria infectoria TaxID=45303 RepID=UPI00221FDA65|nr:uncharacterized protein J4E92_007688 [Alternaria infectoria]KAI4923714.1 hypothetical protein J4E92_007688 [Alternaria infectoria]